MRIVRMTPRQTATDMHHVVSDIMKKPPNGRVLAAFSIIATLLLPNRITWADVDGDPELVDRICVAHRSNLDSLLLWAGEVLIEEDIELTEMAVKRKAKVRFAYDKDREAWLFHWVNIEASDKPFEGTQAGGMLLDGAWHTFDLYSPSENAIQGVLISARPARTVGPMTNAFDPMYYFKVRDEDLNKRLDVWTTHADSDWLSLDIQREGDRVTINEANVNIPTASAQFVFDLSQGGNLTSLVTRDEQRRECWTNEFEHRSGVWVPAKTVYENVTHDGKDASIRTTTWIESIVNEDLPSDTFTLDIMGVLAGASIMDERVGKQWRYKQEPRKSAKQQATSSIESTWSTSLLRIGLGVLTLLVIGAIVWRTQTQQRKSR